MSTGVGAVLNDIHADVSHPGRFDERAKWLLGATDVEDSADRFTAPPRAAAGPTHPAVHRLHRPAIAAVSIPVVATMTE